VGSDIYGDNQSQRDSGGNGESPGERNERLPDGSFVSAQSFGVANPSHGSVGETGAGIGRGLNQRKQARAESDMIESGVAPRAGLQVFGDQGGIPASQLAAQPIFEQGFKLRAGPGVPCKTIFRHRQTLFLSADFG
jgi:hypothetical protein